MLQSAADLLGFVWGDCSAEKHGRAIRVRSGTTHPKFVNLFKSLFEHYGHVRMYPKRAKVTPAEWNLEVDLDGSFEFLLMKNIQPAPQSFGERKILMSFVAGFADAEGSIYFHRKRYSSSFEIQITNTNVELLRRIQSRLATAEYHSRLHRSIRTMLTPQGSMDFVIWKLSFHRRDEVKRLLTELPVRHEEKVTKAAIALAFINLELALDHEGFPEGWKSYISEIRLESEGLIREALRAIPDGEPSE